MSSSVQAEIQKLGFIPISELLSGNLKTHEILKDF